jgi:hypothetical protein
VILLRLIESLSDISEEIRGTSIEGPWPLKSSEQPIQYTKNS